MAEHMAVAQRLPDGWRRWRTVCPAPGCGYSEWAESREHAEYLADEHHRTASCRCYEPRTAEWAPTPCPACKETA